jgi:murein L,D-transpeptidase YafK
MYLTKLTLLGILAVVALSVTGDASIVSVGTADRVVVYKADRRLQLFRGDELLKEYPVSLGGNPAGPKMQRGNHRTPEGKYRIDWRNSNSRYYQSLHISYPNARDRAQAAARGVSPGGDIMIHGQRNGRGWPYIVMRFFDWTDGCIAVSDLKMQEIWNAVPDRTPIEIKP